MFAAVLLAGGAAGAHARLTASDPAANATLTRAPTSVTLAFSEQPDPDFATIVVSDAGRRRLSASAVVIDAWSGSVTLAWPPGNGTYTVAYRVVSVDGHTAQGSYAFTVADPALPPATAVPAASTAAAPGSGGLPVGVQIALGVLLVAIVVLLPVSARRRRPAP